MFLSFFTKTPIRIVMGCVNFASSIVILLLFKRVTTHFSTMVTDPAEIDF